MTKRLFSLAVSAIIAVGMAVSANASEIITKDGKLYGISDGGKYLKGWQTVDGDKYCFKNDGTAVVINGTVIDGISYEFTRDGKCTGYHTGLLKMKDGAKYYYHDGIKQVGWAELDGDKYYFSSDGKMRLTPLRTDSVEYKFDENGRLSSTSLLFGSYPKTIGEYLSHIDFAAAATVELRYKSGEFVPIDLKSIEKIKSLLEKNSESRVYEPECLSEDVILMPALPEEYFTDTPSIEIRMKNADDKVLYFWSMSKNEQGCGEMRISLRDCIAAIDNVEIVDYLMGLYESAED